MYFLNIIVTLILVIKYFIQIWVSDSNLVSAYGNLGSILSSQGRTTEAESSFRKALEYRPNMADVHYNL